MENKGAKSLIAPNRGIVSFADVLRCEVLAGPEAAAFLLAQCPEWTTASSTLNKDADRPVVPDSNAGTAETLSALPSTSERRVGLDPEDKRTLNVWRLLTREVSSEDTEAQWDRKAQETLPRAVPSPDSASALMRAFAEQRAVETRFGGLHEGARRVAGERHAFCDAINPGHRLDESQLVRRLANARDLARLPRLPKRSSRGVHMIVDRGAHLVSFFAEQDEIIRQVIALVGPESVRIFRLEGLRLQAIGTSHREDPQHWHDLGGVIVMAEPPQWLRTRLQELAAAGVSVLQVRPFGRAQESHEPGSTSNAAIAITKIRVAHLDRALLQSESALRQRVESLWDLLAPAIRVEPGLLRELHRALFGYVSLQVELAFWNHAECHAGSFLGAQLESEAAERRRREWVHRTSASDRVLMLSLLERWHRYAEVGVWEEELLTAVALDPELQSQQSVEYVRAREFVLDATNYATASMCDRDLRSALLPWFARVLERSAVRLESLDDTMQQGLRRVRWAVAPGETSTRGPCPYGWEIQGDTLRVWPVREVEVASPEHGRSLSGNLLPIRRVPQLELSGHWAGEVGDDSETTISLRGISQCTVRTPREILHFERFTRPDWAEEFGRDRYGLYADERIHGVVQRFRWIAPGSFVMGSPASEVGRSENEGPQHLVHHTWGFWLADSPCTQALWEAVMGENPSRFKSPTRPVERVSFNNVRGFLAKLNQGDNRPYGLPSEAQWEYACRAGTTTSTYAGDLEIRAPGDAPLLDDIGWYWGNAGVEFELDDGVELDDWHGARHFGRAHAEYKFGGTHPVKRKRANPWGLFDMQGNVYEWCATARDHAYSNHEDLIDPFLEADDSVNRGFRGGAWQSVASELRAARRDGHFPEISHDSIGFRLARGSMGRSPLPLPSKPATQTVFAEAINLNMRVRSAIATDDQQSFAATEIKAMLVKFLEGVELTSSDRRDLGRLSDADVAKHMDRSSLEFALLQELKKQVLESGAYAERLPEHLRHQGEQILSIADVRLDADVLALTGKIDFTFYEPSWVAKEESASRASYSGTGDFRFVPARHLVELENVRFDDVT